MVEGIWIKVKHWADYAGRSDIKTHTWFRASNRMLEDEDFFEFSDPEILAWLYILSLCSQKKSDTVFLNFERALRFARRKRSDLLSAISKLEGKQLDRLNEQNPNESCTDNVRNPCTTGQDSTGQDSTFCTVANIAPLPKKISSAEDLITNLPGEIRSLYSDDEGYVTRESLKAWAWCKDNPRKNPKSAKGFRRFFSSWLERGWERYRKSIPSAPKSKETGGWAETEGLR